MSPEEPVNKASEELAQTAEGPPEALPREPEALAKQLAEERQRAESFYASWQRSAADFANFKRRTEQERADATRFASAMLIMNILPVLDDLERALQSVSKELAGLTWVDGIQIIYRKLQMVLEAQGLKPIEAVGKAFDPNAHEAVLRAPGEEGIVLAELQRGYMIHDRVIRPALVKVGNGEAAQGPPAADAGAAAEAGRSQEEGGTEAS